MNRINELKKVRDILKEVDYKTLSNILDSHLPSVPILVYDFDNRPFALNQPNNGGLNLLYRGRLLTSPDNKPFQEFKQINYIHRDDIDKIKKYGRVNKPQESMFYASTEMAVACLETFSKGIKTEDLEKNISLFIQIGIWKIESPLVLARMTSPEKYFSDFVEQEEIKRLNPKKVTLETVKAQNEKIRKEFTKSEDFEILEFFSDEFAKTDTQDHNEYKLSNYYADRIFNRERFDTKLQIDGIMYPSVPSCYQEQNLVLPPAIVDAKLKFLWSDLIWVTLSKNHGAQFIPVEQRALINEKGLIEWKRVGGSIIEKPHQSQSHTS